ncbi:MAG: orotate phosphoribosyltransferase [Dehalococcoidales bacterium]|jgi:orotate phosphoribosyltransferase|nr:orotate phosphoribosyltransferase [Dehalococcoidales bacterium]MDD4322749.1 orotate phosphoribosyltransferase [Dehalococcoidales bacterium]MDD4794393.1 orotate phosphoribosyltransferase [Dehalococcoidales bacterium]MDD5122372.1 orotate phosphoribosyltransferase [Dehalococcoidales bacterium]MDD5498645.1 orotate phosphoribosyltransferase [Dehalococcoidales bacterium]
MANNNYAENLFTSSGAILNGHFLLTSGLHSPVYWEKFRILQYPEYTSRLCQMIAGNFSNDEVEVVIGPTTGGIILSYEVARYLGTRGIFAEKTHAGNRALKRGFEIKTGERVLLVDDVLTTGKSIMEVVDVINRAQGKLVGIGVLVDRSEKALDVDAPLYSCIRSETITYRPENCPLCAEGIPLVKPGSSEV